MRNTDKILGGIRYGRNPYEREKRKETIVGES